MMPNRPERNDSATSEKGGESDSSDSSTEDDDEVHNCFFLYTLIKFTMTNNYNTKAKGAWKYITALRVILFICAITK